MKLDGELSYSCMDDVSGILVLMTNTSLQRFDGHLTSSALSRLNYSLSRKREAKEIILSTRGIGALYGYLFENLAYEVIAVGGRFQVRLS